MYKRILLIFICTLIGVFFTAGVVWAVPLGDQVTVWKTTAPKQLNLAAGQMSRGPAYLIKNINDADQPEVTLDPEELTVANGLIFFRGNLEGFGQELWKSDGTAEGTVPVKDICPGYCDSDPEDFTSFNNLLYFTADDGTGEELWISDGTPEGTEIFVELGGMYGSWPSNLTVIGDMLYFQALSGVWKSDGTAPGTVLIKDFTPVSGYGPGPMSFTEFDSMLYFVVYEDTYGAEMWKSDGTEVGTVLVADIYPGTGWSFPGGLTPADGWLYFTAEDGTTGIELWRSDGTEAGTVQVKDIRPGFESSNPGSLTYFNGALYFTADDGTDGTELWMTDGTSEGTVLVKDIRSGPEGSWLYGLTDVNGALFFAADDGVHGRELWKSDGTVTGTVLVSDLYYGTEGSYPGEFFSYNNQLIFRAELDDLGDELWRSDGTVTGTVLVKDIFAEPYWGSGPEWMIEFNDSLFFSARDSYNWYAGENIRNLWQSDGTEMGTVRVNSVTDASSRPSYFTEMDNTLFFRAQDGTHGDELWKTDGTLLVTELVKDIYSGTDGSYPEGLTAVGSELFFAAYEDVYGKELWVSDGTEIGTHLVADILSGSNGSYPHQLTSLSGLLYFTANDGVHGEEIWTSDGTVTHTEILTDINPSLWSGGPSGLTAIGGSLYFSGEDGAHGRELWTSDGTTTGTMMVRDILTGSQGSQLYGFIDIAGTIFFRARDDLRGEELWKTDGTYTGTVLVKDIYSGTSSSGPRAFTDLGGTLYFVAGDQEKCAKLWKSDGTELGTVVVKDLIEMNCDWYWEMVVVDGTLFISVDDGTHGRELWKSDGTEIGTVLVKDILPGGAGSYPYDLLAKDGYLLFSASDGEHGHELWVSDGTAGGTFIVQDLAPGIYSSEPMYLTDYDSLIVYTASDTVHGFEPFALPTDFNLSVEKSDRSDPIAVGGLLKYQILVTNFSLDEITATNVLVTDTLPGSVQFASVMPGGPTCVETALTITCDLGDLAPNTQFTITVAVTPTVGGELTNQVQVAADQAEVNTDDNQDTETTLAADPLTGLDVLGPETGEIQTTLVFTAEVSPASAAPPIEYEWEVTDLGTTYQSGGVSDTISLVWEEVGTKQVHVTASNAVSAVTATHQVALTDAPISSLSAGNDSPTLLGDQTAFTALVGTGTNVTYSWDFGDGASGSGANPAYTYPAVGLYQAIVTATNSINTLTATTAVTITDVLVAGLAAANDSPTLLGAHTTFTATVDTGSNVTYSWDFGDDSLGSGGVITHTYQEAGIYTATVTAQNDPMILVPEPAEASSAALPEPSDSVILATMAISAPFYPLWLVIHNVRSKRRKRRRR